MEPGGRLHDPDRRLHELLRHADGRAARAMGTDKYHGLTRKSGGRAKWTGKIVLDRRPSRTDDMVEAAPRIRELNVRPLSRRRAVDFIREVWPVMADTPRHTYQVLTKTPGAHGRSAVGSRLPGPPECLARDQRRGYGCSIGSTICAAYRLRSVSLVRAADRFGSRRGSLSFIGQLLAANLGRRRGKWTRGGSTRSSDVPALRHGVLLQAVGRPKQEGDGWALNGRTYDEMPATLA